MGKKLLEDQTKSLSAAAQTVDMRKYDDIKKNLAGTPDLQKKYVDAIKKYSPDGCADALSDCASVLRGIARKLPRHSAPPPKSNPTSRRLRRQGKL